MTPESVRGDSAYVVHLALFSTDIESFARDENYFLQLLSQNFLSRLLPDFFSYNVLLRRGEEYPISVERRGDFF